MGVIPRGSRSRADKAIGSPRAALSNWGTRLRLLAGAKCQRAGNLVLAALSWLQWHCRHRVRGDYRTDSRGGSRRFVLPEAHLHLLHFARVC